MKQNSVSSGRNDTIDALRIVAAFCVVAAHSSYAEDPTVLEVQVRLMALWTYPFFFLVTGYYLGKTDRNLCIKAPYQIARLIWLFLFSSVLFLPYILVKEGVSDGIRNMSSFGVFCTGTYYHLWFLGSMVTGLLVVYSACCLGLQAYLWPLSVVLVCLGLCTRSYSPAGSGEYVLVRHLLSIPFIYLGVYFARRRTLPGLKVGLLLVVAGVIMQCVETHLLHVFLAKDPMSHLFLVGTTPFAVGMLILAISLPGIKWPKLSKLGRDYSLGVYIVHPLWIPVIRQIMAHFPYFGYTRRALAIPVFIASLGGLIFLEKFLPSIKKVMDGQFRIPQSVAG